MSPFSTLVCHRSITNRISRYLEVFVLIRSLATWIFNDSDIRIFLKILKNIRFDPCPFDFSSSIIYIYIYIFLGFSILHYSIGQQKRFQILWLQNQSSWFHQQFPVKFGTIIGVELLFLEDKCHIIKIYMSSSNLMKSVSIPFSNVPGITPKHNPKTLKTTVQQLRNDHLDS
ncbi:hypothetical protein YC2023_041918 [Brassica napus]